MTTRRLLGLLLASVVVTRLLLASEARLLAFATPTTSSMASLSSGGDGSEKRRVLLHWLFHGGYQVGLLAMHGPQLVGLSDEEPNILVVVFTQHDAELGRKTAQEKMCEEEAGLLSAWAELHNGGEELPRSPGS